MSAEGVLLLGGGGFIGSALVERLKRDHMPVHIIGRHNGEWLEDVLTRCRTVIHLASGTTPGSSAVHPSLELENLALTLRLLEMLQVRPQAHLIFFSSGGAVYGNPARLPITEDCPIAPLSPYGASKVAQEAFCVALREQGHAVTIVRPSNAYGPGQTMRRGFGLIRTMLEHARNGTQLEVWGDGENVRDFIFMDDVVEASMRLIRRPQDCDTYNLGSGVGYSINQVRRVVEAVSGTTVQTVYRPARGVDVHRVVLDGSRLHAALGWQPGFGFVKGVECTWKWVRSL